MEKTLWKYKLFNFDVKTFCLSYICMRVIEVDFLDIYPPKKEPDSKTLTRLPACYKDRP